ncbi:hypothetical protein LIER_22743 [Lithospermum erythrorhizon]|uniref:Uncharacterized protein n=1 Tax=Lithospermum erythrorhizon TaxID=34254 RepID=A0AAV3QX87_LITER
MFSKIGSYVGNPLFADDATLGLARVSYTRLYVEITTGKELPSYVPLSVDLVHEVTVEVPIVKQPEKDSIVDGITEQLVVSPKVVLNVANIFAVLDDDGKVEVSKEIAKSARRKKEMGSNYIKANVRSLGSCSREQGENVGQ